MISLQDGPKNTGGGALPQAPVLRAAAKKKNPPQPPFLKQDRHMHSAKVLLQAASASTPLERLLGAASRLPCAFNYQRYFPK